VERAARKRTLTNFRLWPGRHLIGVGLALKACQPETAAVRSIADAGRHRRPGWARPTAAAQAFDQPARDRPFSSRLLIGQPQSKA
jgi:hypothetical protein